MITVDKRLREYYLSQRAVGRRPIDILRSYRNRGMSVSGLVSMVIGIVAFTVGDTLITPLIADRGTTEKIIRRILSGLNLRASALWIQRGTVGTPYNLPYYQALRVIRKRGWELTKTAPMRQIGRWEALRVLFGGDK